ncbi:MAG: hypothetical protein EB168_10975, partial [Euryarchaeota archaeon]|nr:hypothetical protein [Euryarchaeota archaeon]
AQSGVSSFTLYWTDDNSDPGTSSDNITISDPSLTSYVHGGLDNTKTYKYRLVANVGAFTSSLSNMVSNSPSAFAGCSTSGTLTDTDPDLFVHYAFENSLNDIAGSGTPSSPYNLTNVTSWSGNSVSGTIKYAQGCAYGQAAYFDSTTGYLVNEDFDENNLAVLADNYTVSMWLYPETSNAPSTSRHAILSGYDSGGPDFQLEYRESTSRFEWNAIEKLQVSPYPVNQWYHVALVKHDNGTGSTYVNGALASSINNHSTGLIGMGISRSRGTAGHWKGYIDEVKVFGRAFDGDDVKNACLLYGQCETLTTPAKPDNLTAANAGDGTSVNVSWNAVNGVDNYTVYWTDDPSTPIDPSNPSTYDGSTTVTAPTTSATATGLTPGGNYDFTVVATNSAGPSSPATEVNLLTSPGVPTGLTATS